VGSTVELGFPQKQALTSYAIWLVHSKQLDKVCSLVAHRTVLLITITIIITIITIFLIIFTSYYATCRHELL
jgi:hypothetical protein